MASEEAKDPWKGEEWGIENEKTKKPTSGGGGVKTVTRARKQTPRGLEEKYEAYFLPRKPWPRALAYYGSFILGGIGAGMVIEAWINKKVKEDGGVIWEFDK
ncbi:unnamed protein product [Arabidopsis lyrata]|uniref:Uncharacterized protein n=1 Tax=Arabidopsis lyrata subsp. lyrata TaxID=81972 RepID=D7M897_ARALL|nr:uncharacterized protein LOC9309867 [Arabidopsis lyrata subsp. lyrata]EFH48004.1 hypothetical protein ARALYDRAFT_909682 [Arabidopsis lyrata subsp. lyrata]CAH8271340.1 unnamed protein product [Arabidopsis lyrata]|eukprot:XP_002871745.1 uncharacterized protein LOC9309867 [Arabidopsis lyrata subsp. lyrata]